MSKYPPPAVEVFQAPPSAQSEIAAQAYLHTSRAGALVPLQQAAITGLLSGALVAIICLKQRVTDWWFYGLLVFIIATIIMWTILQRHWLGLTSLQKIETLTGLDINQDGKIGAGVKSVQVNISRDDGQNGYNRQTANFPVSPESMSLLARGLLNDRPFTEKEWCGSGKPFSINEFRAMRSEMLRRGIIVLCNPKEPRQGYKLTRVGKSIMEQLSKIDSASPPPPGYDAQNE